MQILKSKNKNWLKQKEEFKIFLFKNRYMILEAASEMMNKVDSFYSGGFKSMICHYVDISNAVLLAIYSEL